MKKLLAVFLCLLMVCQLMACSGGKKEEAIPDPNLGLYTLTEAAMNGISIPVDSVYEGGFTVLLRENGKAELTVDNQSANGTWTLDGTKFSVKGGGLDLSGDFPELGQSALYCITETTGKAEIDALADALAELLQ